MTWGRRESDCGYIGAKESESFNGKLEKYKRKGSIERHHIEKTEPEKCEKGMGMEEKWEEKGFNKLPME